MSRRWVVDASPLILLSKIDRVALLDALTDELVVPQAVAEEIGAKPGGALALQRLRSFPGTSVADETPVAPELGAWDLGRGELQVLALTVRAPDSRAVLDDLAARRCAQALGVPVIGTLGVVLRARRQGLIPEARPIINHLRRVGLFASDALIEQVLAHLGE